MNLKKRMIALLFGVVLMSGCSGPDTHEKVLADAIQLLNHMADSMDSITDADSALRFAENINSLKPSFQILKARMEKLGPAPLEMQAGLKTKYEPAMLEVQAKLAKSSMKLMQYPEAMNAMRNTNDSRNFSFNGLF